jgi:PKD repeat protein
VTDANQECNTASAEHAVFINARPRALMKITASSDSLSAIAPYSMVTFNAQKSEDGDGFIRRYSWDFGDGGFSEGVFVQHQFKRSGRYNVKLVVQDNSGTSCNTDTASTLLTVTDAPAWTIEGPQEACIEQAVAFSLKATGSGNSAPDPVIWLFSDGDTLQGVQVAKSFHSAGKYQVQAVCRDAWSTTKNIQIIALPSVSLPDRLEADVEEPVEIQPVIVNENHLPLIFQWDLGDGTRSDQPSVRHVYQRSGIYNATFTLQHADLKSCPSSIHKVGIDVYPKPDAAILIRPDTLYSGGARDEATFKAVLSDSTRDWVFHWDFGDGQTASGRCVNYSYPQAGSFTVQLAVWDASSKTARKYTATKHVQVQSRYGQMK